jgi:VIT1/CCC1 family predicted Fe2+/Mn2+ transporter
MKASKILLLVLLGLVFLASGFFRDFVFLNVNEQTRVTYYHTHDSTVNPVFSCLSAWSYNRLYFLKWVLTFLFSFLFMALTMVFMRLVFIGKKYLRLVALSYAALILLAGLFFLTGWLAGHSEKSYIIARFLMGIAQGPIVLMVLLPAFKLYERGTELKNQV